VLRLTTKVLLSIEVVVCFAPVLLLLLLGVLLVPFQLFAVNHEPLIWRGPATVIASVACGGIGLLTLLFVLGKLFFGRKPVESPTLVCTGVALGALPIIPMAMFGDPWGWKLVGALPLAASAHILFLARGMLFSSWRHASRSVAVATVVVLLLRAMSTLDPFHASDSAIREQRARWEEAAPGRYEFTVQLSGWLAPEDLNPKRITVENGEVISASYAWEAPGHKAGDPAPMENLWTIERAFAQLLAAEEQGASVSARFDLRWGFVERAFVEAEEARSGWELEITDFEVPSEARE
jgi:hypothetical protein